MGTGEGGVLTLGDKIEFLTDRHRELSVALHYAQHLDYLETQKEGKSCTKRQEAVVKFIEQVVYDPLIGENVYSKFELLTNLKEGDFKALYTIDLKYVKEMNEKYSYADADEAIAGLWKEIKDKIPHDEMKKIMVSRYGGTFILGIREELLPETIEKLQSLKEVAILSDHVDKELKVPIGNSFYQINQKEPNKNVEFNKAMKEAEDNFYRKMLYVSNLEEEAELIDVLKSANADDSDIIEKIISKKEIGNKNINKNTISLYFFCSKRYNERINAALEILKEGKHDQLIKALLELKDRIKKEIDTMAKNISDYQN